VLLLERKNVIGPKVCAGGIIESVGSFDLPDDRARVFFSHTIQIRKKAYAVSSKQPIRIVDRIDLGRHQLGIIKAASDITILTGISVVGVEKNGILTDKGRFGYDALVGADGATSIVRRYLKLKSKYTIGVYYDIPDRKDRILLYLDGGSLGTGYIWEFPHHDFTNVGVHYHPRKLTSKQARMLLHKYMQQHHYPIDPKTYRAFPIANHFEGCQFGDDVYLAGDAAGLASRLTGEGISFAIISGREVARKILNPEYKMKDLEALIRRKQQQDRIIKAFDRIPFGLNTCFGLFLIAFKMGLIRMQ